MKTSNIAKASLRELCDLELSSFCLFDAIIESKWGKSRREAIV